MLARPNGRGRGQNFGIEASAGLVMVTYIYRPSEMQFVIIVQPLLTASETLSVHDR